MWREEETPPPSGHGAQCVPVDYFDRITHQLRDDLESERDRRLALGGTVAKHRTDFVFAQLENERDLNSLHDELRLAHIDTNRCRGEITSLQAMVDAHHREYMALLEMLERKETLSWKRPCTDGTA